MSKKITFRIFAAAFIVSCLLSMPVVSATIGTISDLNRELCAKELDRSNLTNRGEPTERGKAADQTEPAENKAVVEEEDDLVWYCSKIPMKKEHQKLLWEQSKKNGVDYIDMLSIIALESNFNEKAKGGGGRYRGYFQISTIHGKNLSATLGTKNDPLNGEVNIIWGTAMYSWILKDKRVIKLEGDQKRNVALSIYNRGSGGYDRYGIKSSYINTFCRKRENILCYFKD